MKSIFYLSIIFILISTFSYSQDNYQGDISLGNDNIIQEININQVLDQSIKIETTNSSLIQNSNSTLNDRIIIEFGYQIGVGLFEMDRIALDFIKSYNVISNASIGLGSGVRFYSETETFLIPIYGDFRYVFIKDKTSPYLSLSLGYSFNASNSFQSTGLIVNPKLGVQFKTISDTNVNIGIGYELQKIQRTFGNADSVAYCLFIGMSF